MTEQVLVIPKSKYYEIFETNSRPTLGHIENIVNKSGLFLDRPAAEHNYNYLQIIPYTLVTQLIDNVNHIFVYQRSNKGTDKRLHGRYSVGVGGHVNPLTESPKDCLWDNVINTITREISEELHVTPNELETLIPSSTIIYDPSNSVGEVHLGVIHIFEVTPGHTVTVREKDKIEGTMVPVEEFLKQPPDFMESWTRIVHSKFDQLY